MRRQELIRKLLFTNQKQRHLSLFKQYFDLIDLRLATDLKDTCYDSWTKAPQKTRNAAIALETLYEIFPHDEVKAMATWARGIASLMEGKIEKAIVELDISSELFRSLKLISQSAKTQVSKIYALSLLGRYDEAVETGKTALKIFEKYPDLLASSKIEMNLGNIALRREFYAEAEKFFLSARKRFIQLNDKTWLTMCENDLAITYSSLNDYRNSKKFYGKALTNAREMKMRVTEAEIEASMGNLSLFRGKFDEALHYLELSRQKYDELKMPHQRAIAELEIADIYLELNLADEAISIYEKVTDSLRRLKLRGEEARARLNFGKAALLKHDTKKAKQELKKSARLYLLEKNRGGAATVKLTEASVEHANKNYKNALKIILEAKKLLVKTENPRRKLFAKWLHGETLRNLKQFKNASALLTATFAEASCTEQSNVAQVCLNSLGNLALQTNDKGKAEGYFKKAVKMIETLRKPLPAEEFRMSYLADKLLPYESLAKISLADNDLDKAFLMIEKARGRTLLENLNGNFGEHAVKASSKISKRLVELREELNWFYSLMNRAEASEFEILQNKAKRLEKKIVDLMRQIASTSTSVATNISKHRKPGGRDEIKLLQNKLGKQKTLVEYVSFNGIISAFVITDKTIDFVANLVKENEIVGLQEGLQFQFGALRFGTQNLSMFMPELKKRADAYFRKIYEKLIKPLETFIGDRDLVVIPVGALNYVPFHAMNNGKQYLIETREIVHSPSAAVWQSLNEKPKKTLGSALLIGFADEYIPLVNNEIKALKKIFPAAKAFTGKDATIENYIENANEFDVLHLACHGQFRPDNPMFSSLHLANGLVTVRDICSQQLKAELVTLSACETGLNKIFAGDEILGLARGFLSAGAKSLVLSLWTVNDEATTQLMEKFYIRLQRGGSVAASLRMAQIAFIDRGEHPYFWAPFISIGR